MTRLTNRRPLRVPLPARAWPAQSDAWGEGLGGDHLRPRLEDGVEGLLEALPAFVLGDVSTSTRTRRSRRSDGCVTCTSCRPTGSSAWDGGSSERSSRPAGARSACSGCVRRIPRRPGSTSGWAFGAASRSPSAAPDGAALTTPSLPPHGGAGYLRAAGDRDADPHLRPLETTLRVRRRVHGGARTWSDA